VEQGRLSARLAAIYGRVLDDAPLQAAADHIADRHNLLQPRPGCPACVPLSIHAAP
jgi:hypothetical protein